MKTDREEILEAKREIQDEMRLAIDNDDDKAFDELSAQLKEWDYLEDRAEKRLSKRIQSARANLEKDPTRWPIDSQKRKQADVIALRSYLAKGIIPENLSGLMVRLTAEQGTGNTSGGYTIPKSISQEVEIALKSLGGMWEVSRHVRTEKGNLLTWPTSNDTSNEAYIVDENASLSSGATPVAFGVEEFHGFKITSGLIEVPSELLQDGGSLFEQAFVEVLSQRIWRGSNRHFTNGNGTTQPHGIVNAATYGESSADDQAIAYDDVVNLLHSVDPSYRKNFMFHDSVLKALRLLKEGTTNAPLLKELNDGKLLGLPFVINNHLPEFIPATGNDNKKIMFCGDFSKYIIRAVRDIAIRRVGDTNDDTVQFAALWRLDGDLLDAGTHPVKYLRMATT